MEFLLLVGAFFSTRQMGRRSEPCGSCANYGLEFEHFLRCIFFVVVGARANPENCANLGTAKPNIHAF